MTTTLFKVFFLTPRKIMNNKYDRQLNQIYSRYEQNIDRDLNRPLTKWFRIKPILILLCLNLITGVTLIIREITRPPLIQKADLTLDDVCPKYPADINVTITYNENCYVIPMSVEAYDALISGKIDGYTNDSYHLNRRKSEPLSQSPVLYQVYLDLHDLDGNYLGTRLHNRLVRF